MYRLEGKTRQFGRFVCTISGDGRDGADEGDAQDSGENEENKNVKTNKVTTHVPCQSVMCLKTIVFRNVKDTGSSRLESENTHAHVGCTVWCRTYYTVHSMSQTVFAVPKTELRNCRGSEETLQRCTIEIKTILRNTVVTFDN